MTDDQWRSHFAAKENSELTISEYTKKHGIILSSWYYHRKRLQKTDSKFVPISGPEFPEETSYSMPRINIDACWDQGLSLESEGCILPKPAGLTVIANTLRMTRPLDDEGNPVLWDMVVTTNEGEYLWKTGFAHTTDCADPIGYSLADSNAAFPLNGQAIPQVHGLYKLCLQALSVAQPVSFNLFVDTIGPQEEPSLFVRNFGPTLRVQPIFVVPYHTDFYVGFGPFDSTDCSESELRPFFRIPYTVGRDELPLKFCVQSINLAGNPSRIFEIRVDESSL
ncbi:MAG: hypothetical protein HRU19_15230 [Pseudobacteriovorax sp.]|nr:hypothetical protein [Pseudobacteriovorax sp.]